MIADRSSRSLNIFAIVAVTLLVGGCAARKPRPPLPVYPPIPASAVRQLRYLPSTPYAKLDTVTIQAEVGTQYFSALHDARQTAAGKGGNAMVLVDDKEFQRKINDRQRLIRRTTFWVVHVQ